MTPLSIAILTFACIAGGGLFGLLLHPGDSRHAEPVRDMVRFTQGIVASIAALVLGLLVAGATDHYRSQGEQVRRLPAEVIVLELDRPFHGIMAVSSAPMREALATLLALR